MIDRLRYYAEVLRVILCSKRYVRKIAIGRSMSPHIPAGCWMTFDRHATPRDGDIALVKHSLRVHLAKQIRWSPYGWLAVSFNEPTMPLDGQEVFAVLKEVERRPKNAHIEKISDRLHRETQANAEEIAWIQQQLRPALEYVAAHAPSGRIYEPQEFDGEALTQAREA